MTLQLELAPELEREIEQQAQQHGQSVAEYVEVAVREKMGAPLKPRRVLKGYGIFAGSGRTVDDFLAERHAESLAELEKDEERARLYGRRHEST
jgi:hypothetical protein